MATAPPPISVLHFSDLLCVWAYIGQARMVELCDVFGDAVTLDFHCCQVFGDVTGKIEGGWSERGGLAAYAAHVQQVAEGYPHIALHPDAWLHNTPSSSASPHVFVHAVRQVLEARGELRHTASDALAETLWQLRLAFFRDGIDISQRARQLEIAEARGLPVSEIEACLDSGRAFAGFAADLEQAAALGVRVSPTVVFNEGRQRLNGNVGFRIIEANVRELLRAPEVGQSWC